MSTARLWTATALLSGVALGTAALAAAAPGGTSALPGARGGAVAAPVPLATSEGISLESSLPLVGAVSIEFARTGDFAYVSTLQGVYVLDTSDPLAPALRGFVNTANFENESMTYGERVVDGELQRFVVLAVDLVEVTPTDPTGFNLGGLEVQLVDVTDPDAPFLAASTPATTSTHTTQCVDQLDCDVAYTAGDGGAFSVIDLSDLDAPVEVATVSSPASGPGRDGFPGGAGHYWDFDGAGLAWHTGSGGAAVFDVSDPLDPVLLNTTSADGRGTPLNDFILHNSMRPNADAFVAGAEPSIANGNVLLVTEEDYFDSGEELDCAQSGSFQTWYVPELDAAAQAVRNGGDPTLQDVGTIVPLDATNAPVEFEAGLTGPAAAFCSAHWFDVHQDGFVAQGWYGAGMRVLDVRDPRAIDQLGFATFGASEVWDAYWVPERDADGVVVEGQKTEVVYTADAVRGVDVFSVALPTAAAPETPPGSTPPGSTPPGGAPQAPAPQAPAPQAPAPGAQAPAAGGPRAAAPAAGGTTSGAARLAATGAPALVPLAALLVLASAAALRQRRSSTGS